MKLTQEQQRAICKFVSETFTDYKEKTQTYRETMEEIYRTVRKFKRTLKQKGKDARYGEKTHEWETDFLVNKCHEIENKVLPKIIGNTPKWIVSAKPTYKGFQKPPVESEGAIEVATPQDMAEMVRDYLHSIYSKQDLQEVLELLAKNGVRYGQGFIKTSYKYAIGRNKSKKEAVEYDENGKEITNIETTVDEKIEDEYPCIESKSRVDMYFDPRYLRLEDMPAIIEVANNVRISFFTQNKSDYINIPELVDICRGPTEDYNTYKNRVFSLLGVNIDDSNSILPTSLQVKQFYGYYSLGEKEGLEDERLYEFWTVNDTLLVKAEEISAIPYEDFQVFKDTEAYFATGFLEPIISLQNEMNFQKNTSAGYVNKTLNPPVVRSPNSGIDPRTLNPGPGGIVMTSNSAENAIANLVQYPFRELPSGYFQQQNDRERQIQSLTFTIDTSNPDNQQALTNTATGAKIKDFENNGVTGQIRKKFEQTMVKIAYKLLQYTADNLTNNITVKAIDKDGYREINKEAFKEALSKFDIQIEAGSSSYDSLDARREDAIARWNISLTAKQAGVPVDLKNSFSELMDTFEGINKEKLFEVVMPQMMGLGGGQQNPQQLQAPSTIPMV